MLPHARCAAAADANSEDRSCCSRNDPSWGTCPDEFLGCLGSDSAGYCAKSEATGLRTETQKALAAGCSADVHTIHRHLIEAGASEQLRETCDQTGLQDGRCAACREPQWCDDSAYLGGSARRTENGEQWMTRFVGSPGVAPTARASSPADSASWIVQSRQCLWKPDLQQDSFVDAARRLSIHQKRHGLLDGMPCVENEVNFYVNPHDGDDGEMRSVAMRALVDLVHFRTSST